MQFSLPPFKVENYNETGFLSPLNLFTDSEISEFREQFDELEKRTGKETSQIGLIDVHFKERFVWEMATNPRLLDLIKSLLGENLVLLATHFFCKYPLLKKEHFVGWHQDVTYWGLEPSEALSVWIAIDDSDTENGCMRVIPISHRQGIFPHETSELEGNLLSINQEIPSQHFDEKQAVDICLRPGQVSIHDGLLLHGSNPNKSRRRRCGLTVRFVPSHVRQTRLNSKRQKWKPILLHGKNENTFARSTLPFPLKK